MPLRAPSRSLNRIALPTVHLGATKLYRVSRHASGEPYFGTTGANRFDDPASTKKRRFGTCYFGLSLTVAVAETVLHDEMPNRRGEFEIAAQEFENRYVVRFAGEDLVLANLTGATHKSLAGDGSMSTIVPYGLPQRWSRAIHRHPQTVDGITYMSRHVNDERAVVLFDRAASKLHSVRYQALPKAKGAAQTLIDLRIVFKYA